MHWSDAQRRWFWVKVVIAFLLAWGAWMTLRSVVLQKRLNSIERFVLNQDKKISAAAEMASNAVQTANGKHITPPIQPKEKKK